MKYLKFHWCGRETSVPNYNSKKMSTVLCSCREVGITDIDFCSTTNYKNDKVTSAISEDGRFFIL